MACKRQTSTAAHTQEAETVSLSDCLRDEALPLQNLMQAVLRRSLPVVFAEDNQACIQAVHKGYSPSLRHLVRTQRVSLGALHEVFVEHSTDDKTTTTNSTTTTTPRRDDIAAATDATDVRNGPLRLLYHEASTHKGDALTKFLSPAQYEKALERWHVERCPKEAAVFASLCQLVLGL